MAAARAVLSTVEPVSPVSVTVTEALRMPITSDSREPTVTASPRPLSVTGMAYRVLLPPLSLAAMTR